MTNQRHKRAYPEGPRRELTDEWRQLVLDRLAKNAAKIPPVEPYDRASLARALGADKAGIGRMLLPSGHRNAQHASAWVDPTCSLLGIPTPTVAVARDDDEMLSMIARLGERERVAVLDLIRTLTGAAKRSR